MIKIQKNNRISKSGYSFLLFQNDFEFQVRNLNRFGLGDFLAEDEPPHSTVAMSPVPLNPFVGIGGAGDDFADGLRVHDIGN